MSENAIQLTYLDVRGRCEPVYLLLEDSNVKYINKIITWEEWEDLKDLNLNGPPQFPYYALPVLSIPGSNLKGGKSCVFAETSAILAFLDEYLPENYELRPLETRTHMQMIREASLFFSHRVQELSFESERWLGPEKRKRLLEDIVKPFLKATECALIASPATIPSAEDRLTSANTAAFAAILLVIDLFPSLKGYLEPEGEFESCGELCRAIRQRPRIKAWYGHGNIQKMAWTISEHGSADWIASEAEKYDGKL